ncbi:helix-turn-helix domain-containing protein [Virgisporangium aliadipatigenens]|uniref:helix-turn-helix domain-containing protein n=1 Tax=Virgisporangium aliadipatigenens TaxID=741659 RepID=UPI0019450097
MAVLIGRLFHVSYTLRGVSYLLHRLGWSPQVPTHRAVERDDAAVARWRKETWSRSEPHRACHTYTHRRETNNQATLQQ